ncbi:hypothetical protein ASB83_15015 [Listeria monocytogenes]|nr:hypothetical protein [Listeria monocytogenes]
MTNFYPLNVYVSNYRVYSTLEKANSNKLLTDTVVKSISVLNLKEIKSMKMNLFIYDIDINHFDKMSDAVIDAKRQSEQSLGY